MTTAFSDAFPPLNRLRAFDTVRIAGAMNVASQRLHLSQPAVSRAVRALEGDMRVALFDRTAVGSFLNAPGRILARRVRRFFVQIDEAVAAATGHAPAGDGVSRLSRKLTLVHLRCLAAIADAGSFRRAAQALALAEPTLHRSARGLERVLGVALYRQSAAGLSLSATGAEFARRIAVAAVEIRAGIDELAHYRGGAGAPQMAVGVLMLAPKHAIARAAEKLLRRHPRARLVIREGGYDELVAALRNGALDMIYGAIRTPPPFDDIAEERLFNEPYRVVCRRSHPLTRLRKPTLADLRGYDWIFPTAPQPRRAVLDRLIAAGRQRTTVQFETNSVGAIVAALAASDRLSLLPEGYARGDDGGTRLHILGIRVPHEPRMVGLTHRRDWLPTALHEELQALLRARLPS